MRKVSEENRRAKEKEALSDFRSFLRTYEVVVTHRALGVNTEDTARYRNDAIGDARALLEHLLGRKPTETEVESVLGRFLSREPAQS